MDFETLRDYVDNARPIGGHKIICISSKGKFYEVDVDYDPPRVKEIKVEVKFPTVKELREMDDET